VWPVGARPRAHTRNTMQVGDFYSGRRAVRENLRKLAVTALIGAGAMVATAPSADAATTVGANAKDAQAWGAQSCLGATLYVQAASVGVSYVIPSGGGVITSWSVHGFGTPAPLVLKTVRKSATDNYVIRGSSEAQTVAASGTSTFPARLSVAAGDEIALWVPAEYPTWTPCNYVTENAGDVQAYRGNSHPEPAIGDEYTTDNQGSGFRLNVSAQLEPDLDQDGYGDESQDACPADSLAQTAPCPDRVAPNTRITKAPKPKIMTTKKRAKVKLAFSSSEASTFSCTLDGETDPCSSPFEARVKKGKHHFRVAATDSAGNRDSSPATVEFKVKRKRGH
jgi:hypothetical protein